MIIVSDTSPLKMTKPIIFEMAIEAIFHLSNRTVFAGLIEGYEGLIRSCQKEFFSIPSIAEWYFNSDESAICKVRNAHPTRLPNL